MHLADGILTSMAHTEKIWLALGFLAGLLLTGIPYWVLPYNADFFSNRGIILGFVGLSVATMLVAIFCDMSIRRSLLVMTACFPTAVMLRVVVETSQDPTSHNLFPFELLLAAGFGLIFVLPGLVIGALVRRVVGVR